MKAEQTLCLGRFLSCCFSRANSSSSLQKKHRVCENSRIYWTVVREADRWKGCFVAARIQVPQQGGGGTLSLSNPPPHPCPWIPGPNNNNTRQWFFLPFGGKFFTLCKSGNPAKGKMLPFAKPKAELWDTKMLKIKEKTLIRRQNL